MANDSTGAANDAHVTALQEEFKRAAENMINAELSYNIAKAVYYVWHDALVEVARGHRVDDAKHLREKAYKNEGF